MKLPLLILACVASLSAASRQAAPVPQDDTAFLARGLGIELVEASPLDALDAGEAKRLSAAIGVPADALGDVRLWEALTNDERVLHVARCPLTAPSGAERSVLWAATDDGALAGAAVLDEGGARLDEWEHFLEGFRFAELPRIDDARPRAVLEELRTSSKNGTSDDDKLRYTMLETLGAMQQQAAALNIPEESKTQTPVEEAHMIANAYGRIANLAEGLAPLLGDKKQVFVDTALESAQRAGEMADAYAAGDDARAAELKHAIGGNCRTCHRLELPDGRGRLKDAFPEIRQQLGIGDGFFQIGHDLRITHPDQPRAQKVADALREGALAVQLAAAR